MWRGCHPKCWLFESPSFGVAFVGSSNLSRSALQTCIEWNLRVERAIDLTAYASVHTAIDTLWATAVELTRSVIHPDRAAVSSINKRFDPPAVAPELEQQPAQLERSCER